MAVHRSDSHVCISSPDTSPENLRETFGENANSHDGDALSNVANVSRGGRQDDCGVKLLSACNKGDLYKVKALLGAGTNPNYCATGYTDTPLLSACIKGHLSIVETLLEAGADPNYMYDDTNENWVSPLVIAAEAGTSMIHLLIKAGIEINKVNSLYNYTFRYVTHRVQFSYDVIKAYYNYSCADFSATNKLGTTPLLAIANFNYRMHDVSPSAGMHKVYASVHGTALYYASIHGKVHAVVALLQAGADPNIPDDEGNTPLIASCQLVSQYRPRASAIEQEGGAPYEALQLILRRSPISVNIADNNGRTPLIAASEKGNAEYCFYLYFKHCADPNAADYNGRTPLIAASENGHE